MKNKIFLTFVLSILSCKTQAHIPSLFYTQKEEQALHENRQKSSAPPSLSPTPTKEFHLTGLLYSDPTHWKIWINKKPYDKKNFPGLEVSHITPFEVSFTYNKGAHRTSFTLTPNARHCLTHTVLP